MSKVTRKYSRTDMEPIRTPLHDLIVETRLLFHRLRILSEKVHSDDRLTAGGRGVLLSLHQQGPRTVPQLARSRPVSRQHIQSLVNPLRDWGLVELIDNPAHKRSKLVRLTPKGKAVVARILDRELEVLKGIAKRVGTRKLTGAAAVLRQVRELFSAEF